jgi:hypothetical protein
MEATVDKTTTVFVLDVDERHSPAYVAGIFDLNCGSVMQKPKVFAIKGFPIFPDDTDFHCTSAELLPKTTDEGTSCVLSISDEAWSEFAEISALGRHFMIPFPGSFLDSTSLTRGGVQKSNPFAVQVLRLLETIEFLLSSDGIRLCWAGILEGELLPEKDWVRRFNSKNEELEMREKDKLATTHRVSLFSSAAGVGESYVANYFDSLLSSDQPRLQVNPDSIQMVIKSIDGDGRKTYIDKTQVWWDFIPSSEPDFGFREQYAKYFTPEFMFDKDSDVECILVHFKINDPTIDLGRGFSRLWQMRQQCQKRTKVEANKELGDLPLTPQEYNALRYAIDPRHFIEAISIITTSPELAKRQDLVAPGVEIWEKGPDMFDICSILAVVPPAHDPEREIIWNTSFNYPVYCAGGSDETTIPHNIFDTSRSQGTLNGFIVPFVKEGEELGSIPEYQKIFIFPVPARVVRIPANRVHPAILSNCLLPCYTTSARHVKPIKHLAYAEDFPLELQRVMIPELSTVGLAELSGGIDKLKAIYARNPKKSNDVEFLVDQIRLDKFGTALLDETIRYRITDGKATPMQLSLIVLQKVALDLLSESPSAPSAVRAIMKHVKTEKKRNLDYSLFPDVYRGSMGFEYFKDLSVAANFKANMCNIVDNLYSIYQNHKYVLHMLTLLFTATRMQFGDQLHTLLTGPPEVSKSYIFKFIRALAIPGTMREEGSQTSQSINSGTKDPGQFIYADDVNKTTSPIFGTESEANASHKTAQSLGMTTRTSVHVEKDGTRHKVDVESDHRGCKAQASNSGQDELPPSFRSRHTCFDIIKIPRGMGESQLNLKKGAFYPHNEEAAKAEFASMIKSQQAFCCIILQCIRAGAIPFDLERNSQFAQNLHTRVKDSLAALLGPDNVVTSLRMENAQLVPIMLGKMLERLYAACVSGVFNEPNSALRINAPFNFVAMVREISERGLLQFDISDYVEAISFFNARLSQETTHILTKALRHRITKNTATRTDKETEIVFGETPMNGTRTQPPNQPFWFHAPSKNSWIAHSGIFFNELQTNGRHVRNYNWVDLTAMFGVNALSGANLPSHHVLKALAAAIQSDIGNGIHARTIFNELEHWQEISTVQNSVVEVASANPNDSNTSYLQETNDGDDSRTNVLRLKFQVPEAGVRNAVWHVLVNSKWLESKAKAIKKGSTVPVSPSSGLFASTALELALQNLSFQCCYDATYILPGMTFDSPISSETSAMPHIAKTLKLFDTRKAPEYVKILNKSGLKHLLFFALNKNDGTPMGYTGGKDSGIPPEFDYYSTCMYLEIAKTRFRNMGVLTSDGAFERDPVEIDDYFIDWVERGRYKRSCPVYMEMAFKKIKEDYVQLTGNQLNDYVESAIASETRFTTAVREGRLRGTTASSILGIDYNDGEETEEQRHAYLEQLHEDEAAKATKTKGGMRGKKPSSVGVTTAAAEKDQQEDEMDKENNRASLNHQQHYDGGEEDQYMEEEEDEKTPPPEITLPRHHNRGTSRKRVMSAWEKVREAQERAMEEEEEIFYPTHEESDPGDDDIVDFDNISNEEKTTKRQKPIHSSLIEHSAKEAKEGEEW